MNFRADLAHFSTTFELTTRKSVFAFAVSGNGTVRAVRTPQEGGPALGSAEGRFEPRADGLMDFECWHVDQQLWVFVDGREATAC